MRGWSLAAIVLCGCLATPPEAPLIPDEIPIGSAMSFGMDARYAGQAEADVGTMWIGPWNQVHGWRVPIYDAQKLREQNVTPAYHLYYWGDDLSPACFADGCFSKLHGVVKDQAGWAALVREFVAFLNVTSPGREVVVYLETEFNRHEVRHHEPLDAALAMHARALHNSTADVKVVLSLGNWNHGAWATWDRAVAASDALGVQAVRGSTRHDPAAFDLVDDTLQGVRAAKALADLPIIVHDVAVSSYPAATHETLQAAALDGLLANLPELKEAGVVAITYRSWKDNPAMDLHNTFGPAERSWGLHHADGTAKPAAQVWLSGVAAERAKPA